ncbi:MAG: sugar-binding transcriptional regulator [Armatimonadota bacterium]
MASSTRNRRPEDMMLRAARLYYEEGLSQADIARRLFVSRPEVSRLLSRARAAGIVRITVVPPARDEYLQDLADRLIEAFGLRHAVLAPGRHEIPDEQTLHSLLHLIAARAAQYLDEVLTDDDVLAVAWGYNTSNVMRHLRPTKILPSLTVVPMSGVLTHRMDLFDSNALARDFAMAYGGRYLSLPAPAMVRTPRQRTLAAKLPLVDDTLAALRRATIAVTSMAPATHHTPAVREGFVSVQQLRRLVKEGAVGEISGWYYDAEGKVVAPRGVACYPVGMELGTLREMAAPGSDRAVIGIAGADEQRYLPIFAALRGRLVNVLVTDHVTAQRLLEMQSAPQ